jgi:hypothetical protein
MANIESKRIPGHREGKGHFAAFRRRGARTGSVAKIGGSQR